MSFHEKSLWLLLVSLIVVFGIYFASVLPTPEVNVGAEEIGAFVGMVIVLVIVQIIGAIALAVIGKLSGTVNGRQDTDERDHLIGLKSSRNSSYILAVGVFLSLTAAAFTDGNFIFMHVLLGFWVLAQLVEIGSQLVYYRRGV